MGNMKAFKVMGLFHKNGSQTKLGIEIVEKYTGHGSKFVLVREPDNEFDRNAIVVKQQFKSGNSVRLGYVPKDEAAEWAPLMDDHGWIPVVKFGRKFIKKFTEGGELKTKCTGMQLRYEVPENGKYGAMIANVDRDMGKTRNG